MGSPTCPYCGCLAVTRAVEADGNAPSRSAAYRCERCLKLHERRPTPPAPADFRGVTTYPHDDPPGLADVMKKIPASANATPKRVVYAVRTDERTGRYAAAITRDGVDILHLHVGSDRNTAENVMLVVAALARFHLPVSATPAPDDAVEKAARALIESVPPDFWNNDPPTDDTEVAYAIDYALLDALRAALRRAKGGDK